MKKEKLDDLLEKVSEKDEFVALSSRYKACDGNRFSIRKIVIDYGPEWKKKYERYANAVGFYDGKIEPGEYVNLYDKKANHVMMSNTPMEFYTNYEFIKKSRGNVLIGGLGLGLIALFVEKKPEISSITIVEKHPEIIELILSQIKFESKVLIEHSDIFNFAPKERYDTVYIDIWNDVCRTNYDEMKELKRKYSRCLNESGFIACWREKDCMRL
ncbi:MAG: hypothetical protein NTV63_03190 [Candidatus Woesearchaeota archaeon]|nr:hypothetical protein [Candidatus Woesearchaeota archaeon]